MASIIGQIGGYPYFLISTISAMLPGFVFERASGQFKLFGKSPHIPYDFEGRFLKQVTWISLWGRDLGHL